MAITQDFQPPTLEEFLADIAIRQAQGEKPVTHFRDPFEYYDYQERTGQAGAPAELMLAREMALDMIGIYRDCTPTMAWNINFGNPDDFYKERNEKLLELEHTHNPPPSYSEAVSEAAGSGEASGETGGRPKRSAAQRAPSVWEALHPRKRRRKNPQV
jgi:hypothetical protein